MILLCHNFAALLKEEEAECLCVPNVAGLLPEFFSLSSLNSNVFWSFTKRYVERKVKFGGKFFWSIIIVTLVTQCLPSYFLSRPIA